MLDPFVWQLATFVLTPTQIKSLTGAAGTDIALLPAPGAGKSIVIYRRFVELIFNTTPYATGNDDIWLWSIGAGRNNLIDVIPSTMLTASSTRVQSFPAQSWNDSPAQRGPGQNVNTGVSINLNSGPTYTAGDSNIKLTLEYTTITL